MSRGGNNKGIPHSEQVRERISLSVKRAIQEGRLSTSHSMPLSESHKNAISAALTKKRFDYNLEHPPGIKVIRRWLIEEQGFEGCSLCGWCEHRPSGICPIQVDHIDGNHQNWAWSNLRLLCPNCHSLTPKFLHYDQKHSEETKQRIRRVGAATRI